MENIGDWLYIVILVIAGLSSIISAISKKAKQGQGSQQQPQQREVIMDDTFDDDFWGSGTPMKTFPEIGPVLEVKPIQTVSPVTTFQQKIKASASIKKSGQFYNSIQEGNPSVVHSSGSIMADVEQENALITLEDLPSNIDEWRKAFVNNEIFNRKY